MEGVSLTLINAEKERRYHGQCPVALATLQLSTPAARHGGKIIIIMSLWT